MGSLIEELRQLSLLHRVIMPRPSRAAVLLLSWGDACGAADDVAGQRGERVVVVAGVAAQDEECLAGAHPEPLGEDSLGLLDQDAAVQRDSQLQILGGLTRSTASPPYHPLSPRKYSHHHTEPYFRVPQADGRWADGGVGDRPA